jgi:hypothetical protein
MNMGYEEDELKPYQEVQQDLQDGKRIGNEKTGTVQHVDSFLSIQNLRIHSMHVLVFGRIIFFQF